MNAWKAFKSFFTSRKQHVVYFNGHDDESSQFPWNNYVIYVYGNDCRSNFYIKSRRRGWVVCLSVQTGELISIKNYGVRERNNDFKDIIDRAKIWLDARPSFLGCSFRTNREQITFTENKKRLNA